MSIIAEKLRLDPYLDLTRGIMTETDSAEFSRFNDARDLGRLQSLEDL